MSNFKNNLGVPKELNELGAKIINCAFKVHSKLGPGLLESIYEKCLCYELEKAGLHFVSQVLTSIVYDDFIVKDALKIDLLVEDCIIIELKSVEIMNPVFDAQILSYMKLTENRLGYLINFNVPLIKDGIKRFVN